MIIIKPDPPDHYHYQIIIMVLRVSMLVLFSIILVYNYILI